MFYYYLLLPRPNLVVTKSCFIDAIRPAAPLREMQIYVLNLINLIGIFIWTMGPIPVATAMGMILGVRLALLLTGRNKARTSYRGMLLVPAPRVPAPALVL